MVSLATQVGAAAVPRRQKPGVLQTTRQLRVRGSWRCHTPPCRWRAAPGTRCTTSRRSSTAVLDMQVPVPAGQRWYPALHAMPHVLAVHTAPALGSDGAAHVEHPADGPALQGAVVGETPARRRAGVGAGAAIAPQARVDARRTRGTGRAVDAVHGPAGGRGVVADADTVAEVPAGVARLNTRARGVAGHAAVVGRRGADRACVAARIDVRAAVDDAGRGRAAAARVIPGVAVHPAARPVAHRVAVGGIDARGAAGCGAARRDAVVRHARRRKRGRTAVEAGGAGDAARGPAADRGGVGPATHKRCTRWPSNPRPRCCWRRTSRSLPCHTGESPCCRRARTRRRRCRSRCRSPAPRTRCSCFRTT